MTAAEISGASLVMAGGEARGTQGGEVDQCAQGGGGLVWVYCKSIAAFRDCTNGRGGGGGSVTVLLLSATPLTHPTAAASFCSARFVLTSSSSSNE